MSVERETELDMGVVFISCEDYDRIKSLRKGEKLEIVVEAKHRAPMRVCVCQESPIFDRERHYRKENQK